MSKEDHMADVAVFGPTPNWAAELGEADSSIQNGVCMSCDLPIVYAETDERDDDEICRRYKPYCLNHDNARDWRTEALAGRRAVSALARVMQTLTRSASAPSEQAVYAEAWALLAEHGRVGVPQEMAEAHREWEGRR